MIREDANIENPVDPIDLIIFKEHVQLNFLNILDSFPKDQEKTLVIEKSCVSKLNYFTTTEPLLQRKVRKDIIILKPGNIILESPIIIYLIPPKKEFVQIIQKHIESQNKNVTSLSGDGNLGGEKDSKEFHIIFIPKITNECQVFINGSQHRALFNIHNLNMDIYTLDYELMSLEDPNSFYDLYVGNNYNSISVLTRAIIKYETVFGKIKNKYYKGNVAKILHETLNKEEEKTNIDEDPSTLACIMIDRSVDMVTPLCTQFVYEGLLDDRFGISFNSIKVNPKLLEKDTKQDTIKVELGPSDKFYTRIKDFNFTEIRSYLPARLQYHNKILEEGRKRTHDLQKIQESVENVKKIKDERNSLANHINLADIIAQKDRLPLSRFYLNYEQGLLFGDIPEKINEFIQDEICKKNDEYSILKIICLDSLIHSGFKYKIYEQIKKEFINVYGFQEIFLWHNLEKMGVLKAQDNQNFYNECLKKLNLIFEDVNSKDPNDTSYAYNGYSPITMRLIEKAVTHGWGSIKDVLKKLPGEMDFPLDESDVIAQTSETQFILLVFIGGLTYGELAGIRYLNKKLRNKKFIVLTTEMINSKKIFDSLRRGKYLYFHNVDKIVLNFKDAAPQTLK